MKIRKIAQVLTVLFSVSLVVVFIGFRGGYFTPLLAQQTPHDTTDKNLLNRVSKADTATYKKDSLRKHDEMLWSSKNAPTFSLDSISFDLIKNRMHFGKVKDSSSKTKRRKKRKGE